MRQLGRVRAPAYPFFFDSFDVLQVHFGRLVDDQGVAGCRRGVGQGVDRGGLVYAEDGEPEATAKNSTPNSLLPGFQSPAVSPVEPGLPAFGPERATGDEDALDLRGDLQG